METEIIPSHSLGKWVDGGPGTRTSMGETPETEDGLGLGHAEGSVPLDGSQRGNTGRPDLGESWGAADPMRVGVGWGLPT